MNHALQLLGNAKAKIEQDLECIEKFSLKKEISFFKSFLFLVLAVVALLLAVYYGGNWFFANVAQRTNFWRWFDNVMFGGACIVPPAVFLWVVIYPRLSNDIRLNELEITLINDLAKIISIKNYIEGKIS